MENGVTLAALLLAGQYGHYGMDITGHFSAFRPVEVVIP
jgi:hypothetical protein